MPQLENMENLEEKSLKPDLSPIEETPSREEITPVTEEARQEIKEKADAAVSIEDFFAENGKADLKEEPDKKETAKSKLELEKEEIDPLDTIPPSLEIKNGKVDPSRLEPSARDLTGLPDEMLPYFRKMSNDAFANLKPFVIEQLKMKGEYEKLKKNSIPDQWYENPDAFILTPEFQYHSSRLETATAIHDHWKTQLDNIEEGKDWQDLDWDSTKKAYVRSEPKASTPRMKSTILQHMNHAAGLVNAEKAQLNNLQVSFKERVNSEVSAIRNIEAKYFKVYQDEKHPMRPVVDKVMEMVPPSFRKNPLASLFANVVANNVHLRLMLDDKQANIEKGAVKAADKKKVSPNLTALNTGSGASSSKDSEVTIEDFMKEMV